jgi:hypothetical protein
MLKGGHGMSEENKTKKKAVALAMVVSMVVANPLFATGCEQKQPRIIVDEEEMEKEEEQIVTSGGGGGGTYIYSGSGRHSSPFIFRNPLSNINSSGSTGSSGTITSAGWKTWTTPATIKSSGGYSGIRSSSFSS